MPHNRSRALSRRTFLAWTGAGTLALFAATRPGTMPQAVAGVVPGGTLDPTTIDRFTTGLVVPAVIDPTGTASGPDGTIDSYRLVVTQGTQQMLPPGMPATTVWSYGPADAPVHTPAGTVEARHGVPVRVTWINGLVDPDGNALPHLLPVDPTLHWANPARLPDRHTGLAATDAVPDYTGRVYVAPGALTDPDTQYSDYTGPVPLVMHLHGAEHVGDDSDGYPETWVLPDVDLPQGWARHGTWYDFMAAKAAAAHGVQWPLDGQVAHYPNDNPAATLWVHDHSMGTTRLGVYAGLAGFWLVRGGDRDVDAITVTGTGRQAVLPGTSADTEPAGGQLPHELPLCIQDRSFNADGSLFYPGSRNYFDAEKVFVPESDISPVWVPEFFGNTIIVNGHTWPLAEVAARRYRIRLLNGCNARTLYVDFRNIDGVKVTAIGNDSGLLDAAHDVMTWGSDIGRSWEDGLVILGPAQRADLVVDFTDVEPGDYTLGNVGPDAFFAGGQPGVDFSPVADPDLTGSILRFRVGQAGGADPTTPGADLVLPAPVPVGGEPARTRRMSLDMHHLHEPATPGALPSGVTSTYMSLIEGEPGGVVTVVPAMWSDPVTETPAVGDTEVWEFYNWSIVPHPVHIHETAGQIVRRAEITYDADSGRLDIGDDLPIRPLDRGRTETFMVEPGQMLAVKLAFRTPGQYVWHCHLLEHEDNEMMRPYRVGPVQDGQPMPAGHHDHSPSPSVSAAPTASTPAPSVAVTASPTPTPTPTPSATGTAGPSPAPAGAHHGGGLADSGAPAGLAAGMGALAAGIGAGLLARRTAAARRAGEGREDDTGQAD